MPCDGGKSSSSVRRCSQEEVTIAFLLLRRLQIVSLVQTTASLLSLVTVARLSPLSLEGFVWTTENCPVVPVGLSNTHWAWRLLGKHMWKGKAKSVRCSHGPHPAPSSSECRRQWGVTSLSWLHWHLVSLWCGRQSWRAGCESSCCWAPVCKVTGQGRMRAPRHRYPAGRLRPYGAAEWKSQQCQAYH